MTHLRLVSSKHPQPVLAPNEAADTGAGLQLRRSTAADAKVIPRPWDTCMSDDDGQLLQPGAPEVWESAEYRAGVRRYGERPEAVIGAVGDAHGAPVSNRDHLIVIGGELMGDGFVPVELYPRENRVQPLSRTYVWGLRDMWSAFELDWIRTTLRRLKPVAPGVAYHGIPAVGIGLLRVGFGAHRDWRGVQDAKNRYLGAHVEAVDVLLPWTHGQGAVLFAKIGIESSIGFGWQSATSVTTP